MHIALDHIQIDSSISPRARTDSGHVTEFVELAGEWPQILVRPIDHAYYQYQLIDGFHRFQAADQLGHTTIDCRVEAMDDATAYARALRENNHGKPMTVAERMDRVVLLRRDYHWTQEQIAQGTGVVQSQVMKYLKVQQIEEIIPRNNHDDSPNLTFNQSAALGKMLPRDTYELSDHDKPRLITAPRSDPKARQKAAAAPMIPVIAQAAHDHKLTPATIAALADIAIVSPATAASLIRDHMPQVKTTAPANLAALATVAEQSPRHTGALTERVLNEPHLAADAIVQAGQTLADPTTHPSITADILRPGGTIHRPDGGVLVSEINRHSAVNQENHPFVVGKPLADYLAHTPDIYTITDTVITAYIQGEDPQQLNRLVEQLDRIETLVTRVRAAITTHHAHPFRIVS